MKQEECDGNDKVSSRAKMLTGRFDVVVLNPVRDSSYLDEAQSLSLACFCVLLMFVSVTN